MPNGPGGNSDRPGQHKSFIVDIQFAVRLYCGEEEGGDKNKNPPNAEMALDDDR